MDPTFLCASPRQPPQPSIAPPPNGPSTSASTSRSCVSTATMDELRAWACTGRPQPPPAPDYDPPTWFDSYYAAVYDSIAALQSPYTLARSLVGSLSYSSPSQPEPPPPPPILAPATNSSARSSRAPSPNGGIGSTEGPRTDTILWPPPPSSSPRGQKPDTPSRLQSLLERDSANRSPPPVPNPSGQQKPDGPTRLQSLLERDNIALSKNMSSTASVVSTASIVDGLTLDTPIGPLFAQYKLLSVKPFVLGDGIATVGDLLGNFSSATEFGTYLHLVHNSALTGGRFKSAVMLFEAIEVLRLDYGSDDPSEYVPFDANAAAPTPPASITGSRRQDDKERAEQHVREPAAKSEAEMERERQAAQKRREALAEADRRFQRAATSIAAVVRGRKVRRAQERAVLCAFLMRLDSHAGGEGWKSMR